jgi:flagellar motor switch protein FliN/FliY
VSAADRATSIESAIEQATAAVQVQSRRLEALEEAGTAGAPIGIDNLLPVPVRITVEIGRTRMTLAELVKLAPGSLVPLDREAHEPVDILVNGKIVARGEVVTIDEKYGVRITSVNTVP